jgi:hypothetical protein
MAEEITVWSKIFPYSQMTETSVLPTIGGADKSLARPGRKRDTETEDFDFHISYL